ncbi:MAG: hypothetical protein KDA78_05940 [Planctomycetaceae bacterium]|nr:hypothetical protein [Planctomycetaceae bacterium]
MAVTINIKDHPDTDHLFFEDDDPLYWFLYPYFEETYRKVGQMVDLYDNAEFFAEELLAFFLVLEKAEGDVRSRGDQWDVTLGYQGEDRTTIVSLLMKSDALDRIGALKQMLNHAYNIDSRVVCLGD